MHHLELFHDGNQDNYNRHPLDNTYPMKSSLVCVCGRIFIIYYAQIYLLTISEWVEEQEGRKDFLSKSRACCQVQI
jgi:hypothetical protein